jgi:hypothetical protein
VGVYGRGWGDGLERLLRRYSRHTATHLHHQILETFFFTAYGRCMLRSGTLRESFQMVSILSMISMWRGNSLPMTLTGHFSSASGMTV